MGVFQYITILDPEIFLSDSKKNNVDYMVALLLVLALIRFFILFLAVESVSKMLLTLIYMMIDVGTFLFIMICYLAFSTLLFSALYQDTNQTDYGSIFSSLQVIFLNLLGGYQYIGAGNQEMIFTGLTLIHIFIVNILLLNFMIAILSNTYGEMLESGNFLYKCSLYEYCERYVIGFKDKSYGQLVLHPPPINVFCIFLLPFTVSKERMLVITEYFSYAIFWVENLIGIVGFIAFEFCLIPFVFVLSYVNIVLGCNSILQCLKFLLYWTVLGIPFSLRMLIKDVYTLIIILSKYRGCKETSDTYVEENEDEDNKLDLKQ